MITTSRTPRTQRLLVAAFLLSMLIHLFGGAIWARMNHLIARAMRRLPEQHASEQEVATSDSIRLERRTVPRRAALSRAGPAPRQVPRRVQPPTPEVAVEIAHKVHRSPRAPQRADAGKAAGRPHTAAKAMLSAAQLAQLNARFTQTIVSSRLDLATIQKQMEARPVAAKRYPLQFTGMQATLERGEGYIEPTTMGERVGGTVWYYTHYTYMWPDGHLEDDDIPWPFHYPVGRDLFALHIHLIPLQLPPPGFHLTRPLKPFLAHFLAGAGQG